MELRMIFSLAFVDFFGALAYMMAYWAVEDYTLCQMEGITMQYMMLSNFCWTACFAIHMTLIVRSGSQSRACLGAEYLYHFGTWIFALILTIIPLAGQKIGLAGGGWCWIKESDDDWIYRGLCFYFFLMAVWVFNVVVYIFLARVVRNTFRAASSFHAASEADEKRKDISRLMKKILLYPVTSMIIWTFPLANRIQNMIHPHHPVFVLFYLHGFFAPLQGFVDSIIYGWTSYLSRKTRLKQNAGQMGKRLVKFRAQ
jgi:hypothetical protein